MYAHDQLVRNARESLEKEPTLSLSRVAARLKLDRHTLHRAMRESGVDFPRMRRTALLAAIAKARAEPCRSL